MMRRVVLIGFVLCLVSAWLGCRDTGRQRASSGRKSVKRVSLMKRYDPKKQIQEWIQATKGEGEGAKVKVYAGASTKDTVIGQVNFGTQLLLVDQKPGWYGVRYYSRDGGEFYGWVRIAQTRYIGKSSLESEVIHVEEHETTPLTIEEADEEMRRVLSVPYKYTGGGQSKQFWGGKEPDGYDHVTLLNRLRVTDETKRWAAQCRVELSRLSVRTPPQYRQVLKAYYDALQWYVNDNKSQFTTMLREAKDKRNAFAQYFGN